MYSSRPCSACRNPTSHQPSWQCCAVEQAGISKLTESSQPAPPHRAAPACRSGTTRSASSGPCRSAAAAGRGGTVRGRARLGGKLGRAAHGHGAGCAEPCERRGCSQHMSHDSYSLPAASTPAPPAQPTDLGEAEGDGVPLRRLLGGRKALAQLLNQRVALLVLLDVAQQLRVV